MKGFSPAWPLLFGSIVLCGGCAVRQRPATPVQTAAQDSRARLQSELDLVFSDQQFAQAQWGAMVVSLDRGDTLYERNSTKLYVPASNNKVLTGVTALIRLGPLHRFTTRVMTDGRVTDDALKGNLVIVGGGDPTMTRRFLEGDSLHTFKEWVSRLKEKGIRRIEGDIVGDDRLFEEKSLGRGWAWDNLGFGYSAPVSALQFNENSVTLEIEPGSVAGEPASVATGPVPGFLELDARVVTGPAGSDADIDIQRSVIPRAVSIRGSVPLGGSRVQRSVAVEDPALYYAHVLRSVLQSEGIDASAGKARSARASGYDRNTESLTLLWEHSSPLLIDILKPMLKVSQNLYAETLTRALGSTFRGEGSFKAGKEVVEETLQQMAVEKGSYVYADGSGLSRYNLVSPDFLVRILKFMYSHEHFQQFYDALPVAGVDGTISDRMRGTKAQNNARAKTGTLAYVRSLSGYVRAEDGEMLAFSIIANNFLVSTKAADYIQDSVLDKLAGFSRKR